MYFVIYLSLGFWRRILEKYILFQNENIFLRLASILVVICLNILKYSQKLGTLTLAAPLVPFMFRFSCKKQAVILN